MKIELYAIAAYTIFQKCFESAGLLDDGELRKEKWSLVLRDYFQHHPETGNLLAGDEWFEYQNYLRDRYNAILKTIQDGNPERVLGFYPDKFSPLMVISKTDDVKAFNYSFKREIIKANPAANKNIKASAEQAFIAPASVPVLYSPTTFGLLDILRNPDNGFINFYPNGDFIFEGNISLYIKRVSFKSAATHAMYSDEVLWVKVLFEKDKTINTAYFAEIQSEGGFLKLCDPANLLALFNNL